MKIRHKTTLQIVLILTIITAFSLGVGLLILDSNSRKTLEADLDFSSQLFDGLFSTHINFLKTQLEISAIRVHDADPTSSPEILTDIAKECDYLNLTILGTDGGVTSSDGPPGPGRDYLQNKFAVRALQGQTIITTTEDLADNSLVVRICHPLDSRRLLIATLPGLYFTNIVKQFKTFENGHIFVMDGEGTLIAYFNQQEVLNRTHFREMFSDTPRDGADGDYRRVFQTMDRPEMVIYSHMLRGESGVGLYEFQGETRLCAYRPVSGSLSGWSLGVVVPISEIPSYQIRPIFIKSMLVFWALGILASIAAGKALAKPIERLHEQNRRLMELDAAIQMTRDASESKTVFLANMSHEIRTPLNAIIGFIEMILGESGVRGTTKENLEKAYEASLMLLGLINNILDISKIESGRLELVCEEYDLPSLINNLVAINSMKAADRPIAFKLNLDESLPSRLVGDELRVKQIFNNLLSNAFKYTKEGKVEWSLACERQGQEIWLNSTIKDSGIGIRTDDLGKLFQPYSQLDMKNRRAIHGTGLGLNIVMTLVKLMDGVITVTSEYGVGTAFTVRIKQRGSNESRIGKQLATSLMNFRAPDLRRNHAKGMVRPYIPYAKVLVVDDVQSNLEVARGLMKPYGMMVDCVASGQLAINAISSGETRYDAVFLDHMMPDMDGVETLRRIREIDNEYAKKLPAIALTANAVEGNQQFFAAHGFQDFLSKPINILWLDEIINRWVRDRDLEAKLQQANMWGGDESERRRGTGIMRQEAVAAQTEDEDENEDVGTSPRSDTVIIDRGRVEGLNLAKGLVLFGHDADAYLRSLQSFADTTPSLLDQIREAPTANLQRYGIIVHGIKGSSRNIYAEKVGDAAEKLEMAALGGDAEFVLAHTPDFIMLVEKLISDMRDMLHKKETSRHKAQRNEPDPDSLCRLREACKRYDMDGVDGALEYLEGYKYDQGEDLVSWLRQKVDHKEFKEIIARLADGENGGRPADAGAGQDAKEDLGHA